MSLLPPPAPRTRTHSVSTGVRPPLSISTLARSPANSFSAKEIADEDASDYSLSSSSSCVPSISSSPPPTPSFVLPPLPGFKSHVENTHPERMLPVLVSRTIDIWRTVRHGKDTTSLFASPSSTPRSSTETEYILPLSASTHKTAFDAMELEPPPPTGAHYVLSFPSVHVSLLFVVILFPLSTMVVFFCMSSLPITFAWPRTLSDLAQLGRDLNTYSQSGFAQTAHIVGVLAVSAIWKHAWSVPGSVLWNVLAGALFHPLLATLLMATLTTIGSLFSTLLAAPLAPVLTRIFPRPVELTRVALEGSRTSAAASISDQSGEFKFSSVSTTSSSTSPAWVRLSILRLIGVVPWSALNIACGLTGVALRDCLVGAFIGTLPWTAVTCQIGDILQTVNRASTDDTLGEGISKSATVSSVLAQPSMIFELVFLTVLSLAPILLRNRLSKLIPSSEKASTAMVETEGFDEKEVTALPDREELSDEFDVPSLGASERDFQSDELDRRGRRLRRQRWTWQRLSLSVPRWSALNSPLRSSFHKLERDAHP